MNESIAPLTKSNSHSLTGPTPQSNVNIAQAKIAILREGGGLKRFSRYWFFKEHNKTNPKVVK